MPDSHFQPPDTIAMDIDSSACTTPESPQLLSSTPSSSTSDLFLHPIFSKPNRHTELPPEIILEILSLCAWEDQDVFRHVSSLWYSYILKSLRRTRFSYPEPTAAACSGSKTAIRKNHCGTHKLLKSLTMSYSWTKPTDELRLDKRSDGVWWKEGEVTEEWLAGTFFWTEACTDPPMKGVKIRLKGCYWNGQEGDLVLHMTCFAAKGGVAVSVQDVCSRIKRLFTASPYRNVLVYGIELQMGDDGVPFFSGKAVLTKKA